MGIANSKDLISINTDSVLQAVEGVRAAFDALDDEYVKRKYLGATVNAVITPLLPKFKSYIPKLVTGNLKKSAGKKVIKYKNAAVGLIGYQASHYDESQKGWAQGFIEYGTGKRFVKGSVASSWNTRGAFESEYMQNGEWETNPPYPVGFMKRAGRGQRVELARSPQGGRKGVRPLYQTWKENKSSVASKLLKTVKEKLEKAFAEQGRRQARKI